MLISLGRIDPSPSVDLQRMPAFVRIIVDDGWEFGYCREHVNLMLDVRDPEAASPYAWITLREAVAKGMLPRFDLSQLTHHNHRVVKLTHAKEPFCRICNVDQLVATSVPPDPGWVPLSGCPCR